MAEVTYDGATCIYPGAERPAVNELNLPIEDGEFVVMVGPSGCGKTPALRMMAGRPRPRERHCGGGGPGPGHTHGCPELRPFPEESRRGEHGLRAEDAGR